MVDTSVELCGPQAGQSRSFRPAELSVTAMNSGSFTTSTSSDRSLRSKAPRGAALWQPHAPHRRVRSRNDKRRGDLQNPGIDAVIREELPRLKTFSGNPSSPIFRDSRSRSTPTAASGLTSRSRSASPINVSVPQRAARRQSFGTCRPDAAAEVTRREGGDDEARVHQTLAQRHGYRFDRPGVRGRLELTASV